MYKILVIEDAPEFQLLISKSLGHVAKEIMIASTYDEAMKFITAHEFDLILLDVGLPDKDGFSVCHELQSNKKTASIPIIFITGKSSATDIVTAFSLGAEDYITKPFEPMVLRARVEGRLNKLKSSKNRDEIIEVGDLMVNLSHMKAYLIENGEKIDLALTPTEFKLIHHMIKHPERVFSREQLLNAVWGDKVDIFERTVDVHMSSLRKKLTKSKSSVEAVPNFGYRFCPKN